MVLSCGGRVSLKASQRQQGLFRKRRRAGFAAGLAVARPGNIGAVVFSCGGGLGLGDLAPRLGFGVLGGSLVCKVDFERFWFWHMFNKFLEHPCKQNVATFAQSCQSRIAKCTVNTVVLKPAKHIPRIWHTVAQNHRYLHYSLPATIQKHLYLRNLNHVSCGTRGPQNPMTPARS